jgi:hypothetical protein
MAVRTKAPQPLETLETDYKLREPPTYDNVGLVLASLITWRSCKLVLTPPKNDTEPLKRDLLAYQRSVIGSDIPLFLSAAGTLHQSKRTTGTTCGTLSKLVDFAEEQKGNGLIIVHGVDYSGRSKDGSPEIIDYLTETVNRDNMPMICAIGQHACSAGGNSKANRISGGRAQEFINQLSDTFTVDTVDNDIKRPDDVMSSRGLASPSRHFQSTQPDGNIPDYAPMGLPRLGY